jgi:hypothetical protein
MHCVTHHWIEGLQPFKTAGCSLSDRPLFLLSSLHSITPCFSFQNITDYIYIMGECPVVHKKSNVAGSGTRYDP